MRVDRTGDVVEQRIKRSAWFCESVIRWGLVFLLGFTPLAFGAVQPWAYLTMAYVVLLLFFFWLLKDAIEEEFKFAKLSFFIPLFFFFLLIAFQSFELPENWLSLISPKTLDLYRKIFPKSIAESAVSNAMGKESVSSLGWAISVYPYATSVGLMKLLTYFMVFLLVIHNVKSIEQVQFYVWVLVIFCFVFALFAIAQNYTWNGMAYWFVRLNPGRRPFGPYINRNHFAGYAGMIIPLSFGIVLREMIFLRSRGKDENDPGKIILPIIMAAIIVTALFVSLSRGGIASFFVSTIIFIGLINSIVGRRQWFLWVALFVVVLLFVWGDISNIGDRLLFFIHEKGRGLSMSRPLVWRDSLSIFLDFPIFGTGLGTFGSVFSHFKTHLIQNKYLHAENDYIQLIVETGVFGFLAILTATILFSMHVLKNFFLVRSRRNRIIAASSITSFVYIMLHSVVDFNLHIPANAFHFVFIMGLLIVMVHIPERRRNPYYRLPVYRLSLDGLGKVVMIVAACIFSVVIGAGIHSTSNAPDVLHNQNAKKEETKFYILSSWGYVKQAIKHGERAIAERRMAIHFNPLNSQYHFRLGWNAGDMRNLVRTVKSETTASLSNYKQHFQTALMLDPTNAILHFQIGMYHFYNWKFLSPSERKFGSSAYWKSIQIRPRHRRRTWKKAVKLLRAKKNNLHPKVLGILKSPPKQEMK